MHAFAKSITPPLPSGWSAAEGTDPCDLKSKWLGVSCDNGKVTSINLQSRSISGTLPSEIGNLVSLRSLSLQGNLFTGALPSFRNLTNLQQIYLSDNKFSSIPAETFFTGLTSLVTVSLDRNPFEDWVIPDDLSQSANLVNFTAMKSSVSGSIPSFFGEMVSLQSLRLSYNNLVGGIPTSFAGSGIKELHLNNQNTAKLSGGISVLGLMPQLTAVLLQSNNFTGDIPDLSNCTSLESLNLRDNRLTGVVPESLSKLKSLKVLTLANNLLQGPFPDISPSVWKDASDGSGSDNNFCNTKPGPCDPRVDLLIKVSGGFGYPVVLADSWKGNDPCAKWIFVICDSQGNITVLNFGNQRFGGIISPDLAEIQTLKTVILSNNNLTGTIPEKLAALPQLVTLDVSGNNLTGKMPVFRPTVTFKHSGNPLLGQDLPDNNDQTSIDGAKSKRKVNNIWITAVIAIVVVFGIVGFLFIFIYYRRRRRRQSDSESSDFKLVDIEHSACKQPPKPVTSKADASDTMLISVNTLRIATDNFSESNILGRGGFGVVYRGQLPSGNVIAVKRMECSEMGKKGSTEFEAEIAVLTKVRHRHLVELCGYSIEGHEKLLVYEFMPQGTLCHHLFPTGGNHPPSLNWKQRLIIALDVARGVEYLHSLAQTSFIHRDLKPSNILLDNDMRAKVSDFGLVKLAPDGKNSMETRLAGTFGYLAPEYAATGRVTTKVDVYAFGVVIMELITGRKVLDETLPEGNSHLVPWFRRFMVDKDNNDLVKLVDPALDIQGDDDLKSVHDVAVLACHCTAREAHQRPDMSHVVNVLLPLVDQWKPNAAYGDGGDSFTGLGSNRNLTEMVRGWQACEDDSMVGFDDMTNTQSRMRNDLSDAR